MFVTSLRTITILLEVKVTCTEFYTQWNVIVDRLKKVMLHILKMQIIEYIVLNSQGHTTKLLQVY